MNIKQKINFEKTFLYTTILFALTIPLSRALISFFILLLVTLWVYEGEFQRKYNLLKNNKLVIALSLFSIYSLLSVFFSTDIPEALNRIRLLSYWIVILVIITSIKKENVETVITAFLTGMFISEVLAYGIFFELWSFNGVTPENPSPFMIHINYSIFLAFTSLLLLNRIISDRYTLQEKLFLTLFFLTVTGNLFLAAGRTGQVALIVGIIIMTAIHYKISIKSFLISILLISSIFTVAYNVSDTFQKRSNAALSDMKSISELDFDSSWGIRSAFYITSFEILKEHPFGVGIGDVLLANKEVLKNNEFPYFNQNVKDFISKSEPHNQYLFILIQMGFIGLGLFLFIIYTLLKLPIDNREIKEISIIFVTIFFTSALFESILISQFPIALFILFVGLFGASSLNKNK